MAKHLPSDRAEYGTEQERDAYYAAADRQRAARVKGGLQCPECYGVRINRRQRHPHDPQAYECAECGCNWSDNYYPTA